MSSIYAVRSLGASGLLVALTLAATPPATRPPPIPQL